MGSTLSRRAFLGMGAVGAAAIGAGLAGCAPSTKAAPTEGGAALSDTGLSFLNAPDPIPESDITATETYDVVVVGGSSAGLAAAASAAEESARVICLEKTPTPAGAGTYYGFINTELLSRNGVAAVDEQDYEKRLIEAALGATNPKLVHAYVSNSAKVGDWLEDVTQQTGNELKFSADMGSENTACFDDNTPGASAYDVLTAYGTSKGATYVYETEAVQLEKDDAGRIAAVIAKTPDGYVRYEAEKGVVLATGGYNGDAEMIEAYIPWVDQDVLAQMSPIADTGNTGDGLKMAAWAGARIAEGPHCPMIHFIQGAMPMAGSLFVNATGERFMDEGTSMEVAAQILMRQPGHRMWQISDAKPSGMALVMAMSAGQSAPDGAEGAEGAPAESGLAEQGPMANMAADDSPTFDTLDELAASIDMDPAVLASTVERFNELVAAGKDEDFNSDFTLAVSIDTPPFKAVEAPPCALAMMGGPQINEAMAVLDEDYAPIPGLYASGNCAGGFYAPNYPMQVQSGLARAFCTVSGYLAAKNALA